MIQPKGNRMMRRTAVIAAALVATATMAAAQTAQPAGQGSMQGHTMTSTPPSGVKVPPPAPSTTEFKDAALSMHREMAVRYTGNADKDFAATMAAHHKGAIDMANVELKYGTDPDLRKLATDIIAAQEKEIAFMKAWLAKHP